MKRKLWILMLIMSIVPNIKAQNKPISKTFKHRIWQRKLIFLKENLILDKKEAKNFEMAYKDYATKKARINKAFKKEVIDKIKNGGLSELSESEQDQLIDKKLIYDKKRYLLERDFTLKLRKIFRPEKVIRFFKLERQFDRELLKRLRGRRLKTRKYQR